MHDGSLDKRLEQAIAQIALVDTHEHIPVESVGCGNPLGFFGFFEHYVSSDMVSAGMPREHLDALRSPDNGLSPEQRWDLMAPWWPYARTTGYGRAMLSYMNDLFGVPDINANTWPELHRRILEAHRPGWYRTVVRDRAHIAVALVTRWPGQSVLLDRELFRAIPIFDHYAYWHSRNDLATLEQESGIAIACLDDLCKAQSAAVGAAVAAGAAGIKVFLAYSRTLWFEATVKADAARAFERACRAAATPPAFKEVKPLQDYMMRELFALAEAHRLPVQVHTGLHEGNGNYLVHSQPTLLTDVFLDFPRVRFDVFHAGYPYTGEVAVLAKQFPNVYADLCWVHAISPGIAARTLGDWIEMAPSNKIMAVGGDSNYVEGAYGHCGIARRVARDVLAEKVRAGFLNEDEALHIAHCILRENAARVFRLDAID